MERSIINLGTKNISYFFQLISSQLQPTKQIENKWQEIADYNREEDIFTLAKD